MRRGWVTKGVSDLNRVRRFALAFRVSPPRSRHVPRQDPVCADHGLPAVEDLPSHRRSIQRRLPDAQPQLRRAVSRHGLCATDRESLRDIDSVSGGSPVSFTTWALARQLARRWPGCQRVARLAHLLRVGSTPDHQGPRALRRRGLAQEPANTVYALDATTIDLCLPMFPVGAVSLHPRP